jgi:hypothetical protein
VAEPEAVTGHIPLQDPADERAIGHRTERLLRPRVLKQLKPAE